MADVSGLLVELENLATQAFVDAQQAFIELLIEAAPRKTGALAESFRASVGSTGVVVTGEIWNTQQYASYVDEGTAPHEIQGNPLLAFDFGGTTVIVHSVQHPGTDPDPFWTDHVTDDQWAFLLQQSLDSLSF